MAFVKGLLFSSFASSGKSGQRRDGNHI